MRASRNIVFRPSHYVALGMIVLGFVAGIVSIQNEWWSNWIVRILVVLLFGVAFAILAVPHWKHNKLFLSAVGLFVLLLLLRLVISK